MSAEVRQLRRPVFDPRETDDPERQALAQECIEGLVRACVSRRAWLQRELAAETARFTHLRRRLADQRGVAFIRPEQAEREFGRKNG